MARTTPGTFRPVRYRTWRSGTTLLDEVQIPLFLYHGGRLARFLIRNWKATGTVAAWWLLTVWLNSWAWGLLIAVVAWGLAGWISWQRGRAEGAAFSVADAALDRLHISTLHKQWPLACKTAGLVAPDSHTEPPLRRVRAAGDGTITARVEAGRIGVLVPSIQKQVVALSEVIGCREVVVTPKGPGVADLAFHWRDAMGRHLALADLPLTTQPNTITYGRRQDGTPAVVKANQSILIGGLTRSGKSNLVWVLLADLIRQGIPVRLYVSDPKGGVELDALEAVVGASDGLIQVRQYVSNAADTVRMLTEVENAMKGRTDWMKRNGVRKIVPDVENPLVVTILDETLPLTDLLKKGTDSPLGRVGYTGSAAAYTVWANTQVAQVDSLGRFRDLIPQRICFATPNPQVTDSVLGQGADAAGAKCDEIRQPGVGYSYAEGDRQPRAFRSAEVTDDDARLIATGKLSPEVMHMAEIAAVSSGGGQTVLYRFYGGDDSLLYIGITNDFARRAAQHALDKDWWPLVASHRVETFPSRTAALAAERSAILTEKPLHNKQHNPRLPRRGFRRTQVTPSIAKYRARKTAA